MKDLQIKHCLEFFSEIMSILKTTHQYEKAFHLIVDRIVRLYRCQTCAIVLINPKTEYLSIENSYGLSQTFCNEFRQKLATGAIGELLWTGKPIVISDSNADAGLSREIQLEHPFNSCIGVQVAVDHRTLGYLYADSKDKGTFGLDDIQLLQLFADLAGQAFIKHQLYEENLQLERVDRETGLEKYGPFLEKVKTTLERAQNYKEQFHLVILDIDNFKTISNTYGHETVKQMLKQLADLLKMKSRPLDVAARYGIDEFIMMLDKTSFQDAISFAKTLRETVEKTSFTERNIPSTISIGISSYPQNATDIEDLLVTAKNALFEAQRKGKNTVFSYPEKWYARGSLLTE